MAAAARRLADGDLYAATQAKGSRDVLGQAATAMTGNLRSLIGAVAGAAEQVQSGSRPLAEAAQQVGQASQQIARAIEDVARGTAEQSKDSALAIAQVSALDDTVRQVAADADAQRQAVDVAAVAIGQLHEARQRPRTA